MCVDTSHYCPHMFITGSMDSTAKLWDLRTTTPVHTLTNHTSDVTQSRFSPLHSTLVATSSADHTVCVWDLSKIDENKELMFIHAGSTHKVSDIAWNHNETYTLASVTEGNQLQVWQIANDVIDE